MSARFGVPRRMLEPSSMPASRSLRRSLSVLFALQTVGFTGLVLRDSTAVGALTLGALGASGARVVDTAIVVLAITAGLAMGSGRRWSTVAGGGIAGAVMLTVSIAEVLHGGHFGSWLAPAAHAVRWATPIVIAALAMGATSATAIQALRGLAGLVFVAHGMECLLGHPGFIDFLIRVPDRLWGLAVDETRASWVLTAIGALDVLVGTAVSLGAGLVVTGWMTLWGFLTACVRLLYWGGSGWPDALVRVANGGVPLLVAMSMLQRARP